jgi:hypothetical protein
LIVHSVLQEERRRERRMRKSGRGEEEAAAAPARPVERRETHKMLQVWTVTMPGVVLPVPRWWAGGTPLSHQ